MRVFYNLTKQVLRSLKGEQNANLLQERKGTISLFANRLNQNLAASSDVIFKKEHFNNASLMAC